MKKYILVTIVIIATLTIVIILIARPKTETPNECTPLSLTECQKSATCEPKFGPSSCSPDGRVCTMDYGYKGCLKKK